MPIDPEDQEPWASVPPEIEAMLRAQLSGSGADDVEWPDESGLDNQPARLDAQRFADIVHLPDVLSHGDVEVQGVGFYQSNLHAVAAHSGLERPIPALLLPDPDNRFDASAVDVCLVAGDAAFLVGHLARHSEYKVAFASIHPRGIACQARISDDFVGNDDPDFLVAYLDLGTPAEIMSAVWAADRPPVGPHRWSGVAVAFTGPSHFGLKGIQLDRGAQRFLARVAGCDPKWDVTRKTGLCIASDSSEMTANLRKARDAGIPIVSEADFWAETGLDIDWIADEDLDPPSFASRRALRRSDLVDEE